MTGIPTITYLWESNYTQIPVSKGQTSAVSTNEALFSSHQTYFCYMPFYKLSNRSSVISHYNKNRHSNIFCRTALSCSRRFLHYLWNKCLILFPAISPQPQSHAYRKNLASWILCWIKSTIFFFKKNVYKRCEKDY